MKKLFIFATAALGMLACTEKNTPENGGDDNGGSTNPKEISCDPSLIEVDASQNSTAKLTLTANGAWSATTNVDWITIEPMSGQGSAFVNIEITAGAPIEGRIIFSTNNASAQVVVKRVDKYPGSFSIDTDKRVHFSQGNLQYNAGSNTWRFAEHQYDVIGTGNNNSGPNYNGWVDLFGWGASGYNGIYPWQHKVETGDDRNLWHYYYYEEKSDIANTKYDWGKYNAISNGGNQAGLWRTLTDKEWYYIISKRPNASKLRGKATINNINGVIILPDAWNSPENIKFSTSDNNVYTLAEWQLMETAGAIFLPYAGFASSRQMYYLGENGYYWSSSANLNYPLYAKSFECKSFRINDSAIKNYGYSVRLVKDVE